MYQIGVELLKRFKEEFATYEKERQELTNAERLFGLPISMYPELNQMEKELKGLDQIFSIYTSQQVSDTITQEEGGEGSGRRPRGIRKNEYE